MACYVVFSLYVFFFLIISVCLLLRGGVLQGKVHIYIGFP